jgi:hypothetical protein
VGRQGFAFGILRHQIIDQDDCEIEAFAGASDRSVQFKACRQQFLNRGVRRFEGQLSVDMELGGGQLLPVLSDGRRNGKHHGGNE